MIKYKENKAITLLALIVTIIVLLILSGISIAMLTGENGIYNNAVTAKRVTDEGAVKEKIGLAIMAARIDGKGKLKIEDVIRELEKEGITVEGTPTTYPIKVKVGNYQYTISENGNVNEIVGITISDSALKLVQGDTKTLTVELETGLTGTVSWSSSDESIATVENGEVEVQAGTGTAIITASVNDSKTGKTYKATCTVTVEAARVAVTAAQIAANPSNYYGQEVKNYTKGGTYRIFYVDTAGEFGDANTIYLKADSPTSMNLGSYTSYTPKTTSVLEKMNPDWWSNRSAASWNANEHCAAYLCDPTTQESTSNQAWANYFDSSKANYVIGSPSAEMYVKSYNQVSHTVGNYTLGAKYRATRYPGYIYTLNGAQSTVSNSDYYTGDNTLDYVKYNSMYCGKNGSKTGVLWLASPSSGSNGSVCSVYGDSANLSTYGYSSTNGVAPLVSLKSGVLPEIEM